MAGNWDPPNPADCPLENPGDCAPGNPGDCAPGNPGDCATEKFCPEVHRLSIRLYQ